MTSMLTGGFSVFVLEENITYDPAIAHIKTA